MKKYLFILLILSIPFFISCSDNKEELVPSPQSEEEKARAKELQDGINILSDDSLAFVLYAPGKKDVHLIGAFTDWEPSDKNRMYKDGDHFWIRVGGLEKGKEYVCQYLIDNKIRVADPYATKISDPHHDSSISSKTYPNMVHYPSGLTTEIAMVVSTTKPGYKWQVKDFKHPDPDNMVIYEILIRDFKERQYTGEIGTINAVKEKIPYLKSLGVDAIELMPFNEFEGNDSWGYNPSFYFATDKAYGTDEAYKSFIDECHKNGIAVIMDMVLNHAYGQCPMVRMYQDGEKAAPNNPWFNVQSPNADYHWGYDFNHESKQTQQFVDSVCSYWMSEYKIDGFRFDFTKGFTNTPGNGWNYDSRRIVLLKRMTDEIKKRKPEAIVIFEHLADNKEEKELAEHGIYLWGNMNYNFNEATMGWGEEKGDHGNKGDLTWASYKQREWTKPHLISYMESHDEERLMFKNKEYGKTVSGYDVKDLNTGLKRTEAATVIYMTIPGPKMIWQFGELGYDYKLGATAEEGRLEQKPAKWDYLEVPERKALLNVYTKMIKLKKENPAFVTTDFVLNLTDNYKQVLLKSASGDVCAIANFDVVTRTSDVNFGSVGEWKDYFSGNSITISGTTQSIGLEPGEYRLYMK